MMVRGIRYVCSSAVEVHRFVCERITRIQCQAIKKKVNPLLNGQDRYATGTTDSTVVTTSDTGTWKS